MPPLQLAVWEIEFEDWNGTYAGPDPWGLTSGNFVSNSLSAAMCRSEYDVELGVE